MNLANSLERPAFYFPDRPAVIEGDREISFLEFNQDANRAATALINMGVQTGDHAAL